MRGVCEALRRERFVSISERLAEKQAVLMASLSRLEHQQEETSVAFELTPERTRALDATIACLRQQPFSLPRTCRDGCSTSGKEWGIRLNCSETRTRGMFCTFNIAILVRRRSARPAGKLPCSLRGRCGRPADRRSLPPVRLQQAGTLRGPNRCWDWNSVAEQKNLWRCRRLIMSGIACCTFRKICRTAEAGQKRSIWPAH